MKKNISWIALLLFLGIFLPCCKYDKVESGCVDSTHSNNFPPLEALRQTSAMFNPKNSDEIIFIEYRSGEQSKLFIWNILNKEKRLLEIVNLPIYRADWGEDGWILLNTKEGNTWKIRENGSRLSQITFSNKDYNSLCAMDKRRVFLSVSGESGKHYAMEKVAKF